jgi:hypothetical protein
MNTPLKYGLFFLGGMAAGALGAVALGHKKLDYRPLVAGLLSRGLDVKEAIARQAECLKENADDVLAEAQALSDRRKQQNAEPAADA